MPGNDKLVRHGGSNVSTPARTSPYPVSRLAPAYDLVDMAREIAEADNMLGAVAHAKLEVIAEQIRTLQEQARKVMQRAADDADLHRASCSFQRRVGQTYHMYRRPDGRRYFSLLAPEEWSDEPPHVFEGSYRLEADMSWSAARGAPRPEVSDLRAAIGVPAGDE